MKTLMTAVLALVLTASLLVGCGCTNRNDNAPAPTVLPTNEELWDTTEATTRATTENTTVPMTTDSTIDTTGSTDTTTETGGMLDGTTAETEAPLSRSAGRMMPGRR